MPLIPALFNAFSKSGDVKQDPLQGYEWDSEEQVFKKKGAPSVAPGDKDYGTLTNYTDESGTVRDPNLYKPISGFFPRLFNPENVSYVNKANAAYANEPLQALDANNTRLNVDTDTVSRMSPSFIPKGLSHEQAAASGLANLRPSQLQQESVAAGVLQGGGVDPLVRASLINSQAGVNEAKTRALGAQTDVDQDIGQLASFEKAAALTDSRAQSLQSLANAPARQAVYSNALQNQLNRGTQYEPLALQNDIAAASLQGELNPLQRSAAIANANLGSRLATTRNADLVQKARDLEDVGAVHRGEYPDYLQSTPDSPYMTRQGMDGKLTVTDNPLAKGKAIFARQMDREAEPGVTGSAPARTGFALAAPPGANNKGAALQNLSSSNPSVRQAVAATPQQKIGQEFAAIANQALAAIPDHRMRAQMEQRINDAVAEELTKALNQPTEYIGSSNISRNPISVLRRNMQDKSFKDKVSSLPEETVRKVYANVLFKLGLQ